MFNKLREWLVGGEEDGERFSPLLTDMHSHLIWGIDDGAKTEEDAVAIARELVRLGYRKAITTPHFISDSYPNTTPVIRAGLTRLREALQRHEVNLEVEASAEYYVDEIFEEMIGTEPLLAFGGDKRYVLFETNYVNKPFSLGTVIFELRSRGYTPILAHPERYTYLWKSEFSEFEELYEMDIRFQVNISSFNGDYGERAAKIAKKLLDADMIDFLGTDIHRVSQAGPLLRALENRAELRKLVHSGRLLNATL